MNILDLTNISSERILVIGAIEGDYQRMIDLLYEQNFSYNDILVLTGDFINKESSHLLDIIHFLKNNSNCYSVAGKHEIQFLADYFEEKLPDFLVEICDIEVLDFLESLPLAIKVKNNTCIVSTGLEPKKDIKDQEDEVFYSIPHYDPESRYYQFENEEKKSWFDFSFESTICFSDKELEDIQVEAGYNLRTANNDLVCLIIVDDEAPIIVI